MNSSVEKCSHMRIAYKVSIMLTVIIQRSSTQQTEYRKLKFPYISIKQIQVNDATDMKPKSKQNNIDNARRMNLWLRK